MEATTQIAPTKTRRPRRLPAEVHWGALAVAAFHAAYFVPPLALLMVVYLYGLVRLTEAPTARRAFYSGFAVGMACFAPQLWFFTTIFHAGAVALWAALAIWTAFFVLIGNSLRRVLGLRVWAWWLGLPVLWTGLEYFRCELYYLKFAWLTPGIALSADPLGGSGLVAMAGVYGAGFILMLIAAGWTMRYLRAVIVCAVVGAALLCILLPSLSVARRQEHPQLVVGIQLESPSVGEILNALDTAVSEHPDAALLVMSEYSLGGPPPESICAWCRGRQRYLVIGGKQPLTPHEEEPCIDTAFVIGPMGDIVFSQGKCVPIQFFNDGEPARQQALWESPWGKIGICICYDLSYTRVTDELVRQGARLLIVPAMDAAEWGAQEHALHARIAPARAVEYGIPIVRVASSGISQIVDASGIERARAPYPGQGATVVAPILGHHFIAPHLPQDRRLALLCVVLTGLFVAGLVARKPVQRLGKWRKDRWQQRFPGLRD